MIDLAPHSPYSLELLTPVLAAAGSLGYGIEVARQLGFSTPAAPHGLAALVTRTCTLRPHRGHVSLIETPAGLLYADNEANPGLRIVRERFAPIWASWELPVVLSLSTSNPDELRVMLSELELCEGLAGVELPLSLADVASLTAATTLLNSVRAATHLPLLVKLPACAPALPALARAVAATGVDALVISGAQPAAAPGPNGLVHGWLCGPAMFPLTLRAVADIADSVSLPVIGVGGVNSPAAAQALIDAGATAVGLASVLLTDLRSAARIAAAFYSGSQKG